MPRMSWLPFLIFLLSSIHDTKSRRNNEVVQRKPTVWRLGSEPSKLFRDESSIGEITKFHFQRKLVSQQKQTKHLRVTKSTLDSHKVWLAGDSDVRCCYWAQIGECEVDRNPFFMRSYCQKSCGTFGCKVSQAHQCPIRVNTENCPWENVTSTVNRRLTTTAPMSAAITWEATPFPRPAPFTLATLGPTTTLPPAPFLHPPRKRAVHKRPPSPKPRPPPRRAAPELDSHPFCCYWAGHGQCQTNPGYMRSRCQRSCGTPGCQARHAHLCKTSVDSSICNSTVTYEDAQRGRATFVAAARGGKFHRPEKIPFLDETNARHSTTKLLERPQKKLTPTPQVIEVRNPSPVEQRPSPAPSFLTRATPAAIAASSGRVEPVAALPRPRPRTRTLRTPPPLWTLERPTTPPPTRGRTLLVLPSPLSAPSPATDRPPLTSTKHAPWTAQGIKQVWVTKKTASDANDFCCFWAQKGDCDSNFGWMRTNCQLSCGTHGCARANAASCVVRLNVNNCKWKVEK